MTEAPAAVGAWWGRVFTDGAVGGNHTAVLLDEPAAPDRVAAMLAVPDTGIVLGRGDREIRLRTFSPVEELKQCFQTSLAVLTALQVPVGEQWTVRHPGGEPLLVERGDEVTWARYAVQERPVTEQVDWPRITDLAPDGAATAALTPEGDGAAVILRQARSRLYLRCAEAAELEQLSVRPAAVLELCARTGTNGIVFSAPVVQGVQRVRVFTTSLAGGEDSGTGGAVLGVGLLAAAAGRTGEWSVVQGPPEPDRQGRLLVRIDAAGVSLGGQVHELMRGTLTYR